MAFVVIATSVAGYRAFEIRRKYKTVPAEAETQRVPRRCYTSALSVRQRGDTRARARVRGRFACFSALRHSNIQKKGRSADGRVYGGVSRRWIIQTC